MEALHKTQAVEQPVGFELPLAGNATEAAGDAAVVSLFPDPNPWRIGNVDGFPVNPLLAGTAAERELQLAHQVQQSLLPKIFPSVPGFEISGFCRAAGHVGGDFFDVFRAAPDRVVVVIADVMGKGVPAALFAAIVRSMSRMVAETTASPAEMLARINVSIGDELSAVDMFATAQIAVIDSAQKSLVIASAGHPPVLTSDWSGRLSTIGPPGIPLGVASNAEYGQHSLSLDELSCALLYSDGMTEALNSHGELFGQDGLEHWLRRADTSAGAAILHQELLSHMDAFAAASYPRDDQTFVLITKLPMAAASTTCSAQFPVTASR